MSEQDHKRTALTVEDDEHISYLLDFMLRREGFEVVNATDGRQAQQCIEEMAPPAIVLLDIMLPYLDGFELVAKIRRTEGWQDVPVIMISTRSMEKDIVRGLEAGANDYVVKPFNPVELLARVRRHINKPSGA